ncbi:MAG: 2'-5' RNA ligase family protein [Alphaproteobacteria bacterium]|nr:2'-5' RNA ligase family protein [Alphaproteobacteria bacterium]
MSLVILGRPRLTPTNRAWIDTLRSRHRGNLFAGDIGPHVTFVFPTEAATETGATSHLATVAGEIGPLALSFRCALPVKDTLSGETYVYLVPDEGLSGLVRLHDRLYTGPFAETLRLDLPYLPHITLGRFDEPHLAKALADDLNAQEPEITGRLETVELFRLSGGGEPPKRLAELALRG